MADIILILDEAEAHAAEAAFAAYRGTLLRADAAGGDAAEAAQIMGPVFGRVDRRLQEQMYGLAEPTEPIWFHDEQADGVTSAKAEEFRGDHHIYPSGIGR